MCNKTLSIERLVMVIQDIFMENAQCMILFL